MNREEFVLSFIDLTGTDVDQAVWWYAQTNGNLERAIQGFFDNPAAMFENAVPAFDRTPTPPPPPVAPPPPVRAPLPDMAPQTLLPSHHHTELAQSKPEVPAGAADLKNLYLPESYMLSGVPLSAAQAQAVEEKKWLVVFVQNTDNFTAGVINRDGFRDSVVTSILSASFVVWHAYTTDVFGASYMSNYKETGSFAIAILYPPTMKKIYEFRTKRWFRDSVTLDAQQFADDLMTFLDSNSYDAPKGSPGLQPTPPSVTVTPLPNVGAVSDEDEIRLALAQSMQEWKPKITPSLYVTDNSSALLSEAEGTPVIGVCRIRLPDSTCWTIKVDLKGPCAALYEFIVSKSSPSQSFLIKAGVPPKPLPDSMEVSMEAAGVTNMMTLLVTFQ